MRFQWPRHAAAGGRTPCEHAGPHAGLRYAPVSTAWDASQVSFPTGTPAYVKPMLERYQDTFDNNQANQWIRQITSTQFKPDHTDRLNEFVRQYNDSTATPQSKTLAQEGMWSEYTLQTTHAGLTDPQKNTVRNAHNKTAMHAMYKKIGKANAQTLAVATRHNDDDTFSIGFIEILFGGLPGYTDYLKPLGAAFFGPLLFVIAVVYAICILWIAGYYATIQTCYEDLETPTQLVDLLMATTPAPVPAPAPTEWGSAAIDAAGITCRTLADQCTFSVGGAPLGIRQYFAYRLCFVLGALVPVIYMPIMKTLHLVRSLKMLQGTLEREEEAWRRGGERAQSSYVRKHFKRIGFYEVHDHTWVFMGLVIITQVIGGGFALAYDGALLTSRTVPCTQLEHTWTSSLGAFLPGLTVTGVMLLVFNVFCEIWAVFFLYEQYKLSTDREDTKFYASLAHPNASSAPAAVEMSATPP